MVGGKVKIRLAATFATLVAGCTLCGAVNAAAATAPRWALTVVPTPTNLVPDSPRSQEDKLTVEATGGSYKIAVVTEKDEVVDTSSLPYDASATEVEDALNELFEHHTNIGEVAVTEVPVGGSAHSYDLKWVGSGADKSMRELKIEELAGETRHLTGGGDSVTIVPTVVGTDEGEILVTATNVGGSATHGEITLSNVVPTGLTVTAIQSSVPYQGTFGYVSMSCEPAPAASCVWSEPVLPGGTLELVVHVKVAAGIPANALDEAHVSGGGPEAVSKTESLPVSAEPAGFGIAKGSALATLSSSEAGAHANVTAAFDINTAETQFDSETPKELSMELPQGLVGKAVGVARCPMSDVAASASHPEICPRDAMVGIATVKFAYAGASLYTVAAPIYNIPPAPGEPAAFGFVLLVAPVRLDTSVLSNGNYAVKVSGRQLNEGLQIVGASITMWGVPQEFSGAGPAVSGIFGPTFGEPNTAQTPVALLTNPQQCSAPLHARAVGVPWVQPTLSSFSETLELGTLTGCNKLRFDSSFSMLPDTLQAGAPAGYNFDLRVPQSEAANGVATPDVKNVKLTLPEGTVISPSAATGLKACSNAQFYGPDHGSQESALPANCPREAQVGTVMIKSPDLEESLEGQVYLAEPECDPCTSEDAADGKMVRLFIQAVSEGEGGIVVKLEGRGRVNQQTGQITTEFEENPQLPFSELKLKLNGGERAVLANPRSCGIATSSLDLTPWSAPETPDSLTSDGFEVNQNCFAPQFKPTFAAGMPNIQAGAHGEFTLAFGRSDDDEMLKQISMVLPPGLLGTLTGVELCKEAQAIAGTCGANSLIGTTQVLTGPGADPFLVEGGKVFLTEGYGGAQFGLSIVVPAVAGPYTLGGVNGEGKQADDGEVVVRSKLYINPITTQLTAVSEALPSVLDGIPLQLRAVNVRLNKSNFTFNPTSCEKMAITATIASQEGISANVSSPFQVTNCASLGFAAKLTASTQAKTSRRHGASLHVAISYPQGSQGSQANIHEVKVELPKALPSELKTLQHACLASQFEANPAGCPKESIVGHAKALTPIVPVPLQGPAYFVSYGGAKFPELVIVLQGYGITVDLHGQTFISKKGITSSTFKTVPDDPVQSFELTLPEQQYSALGAPGGKLCAKQLVMPTTMIAQNGAEHTQDTPVAVTGCPDALVVESRKETKGSLTLKVAVPAAGKLTLAAKNVRPKTKKAASRETLTLELALPKHTKAARKLKLKLTFQPAAKRGKRLTKTTTVRSG